MLRNETKLMESAIALAEDLHFQRAARRLRISQPMLTKNIKDLETLVGAILFVRNRKNVTISDAGRAYIQQARLSLHYGERAVHAARAAVQSVDEAFRVGRSPYTDPFLVSTLLSIRLPLFPHLRLDLVSQFSMELIDALLSGVLDMAIATEPPESSLLTKSKIAESPFYVAMARKEPLARFPAVTLDQLNQRKWILFERKLHPPLYDSVFHEAGKRKVKPAGIQHIVAPEEAFPFVADSSAVALVVKAGALLLARNGVTVRPLAEPDLTLKTFLVSRADDESKITSELARAYMRKLKDVHDHRQLQLPISA